MKEKERQPPKKAIEVSVERKEGILPKDVKVNIVVVLVRDKVSLYTLRIYPSFSAEWWTIRNADFGIIIFCSLG